MDKIIGKLTPIGQIVGNLSVVEQINGRLSIPERITPPIYGGPVLVTPTQGQQILDTGGYYLLDNIVVEPIPQNYGLITWDGSTLTVS